MVISSSKKLIINRYRIRSVSFPSNSNPILIRLEQHLNDLKHREESSNSSSSAEKIAIALSGIAELYICADEAISLPRRLRDYRDVVEELLEGSLKLLDVCGIARDVVARLKESVRDLQSMIRRRKDEETVEEIVSKYASARKEAIKDAKLAVSGLKKVVEGGLLADEKLEGNSGLNDDVFGVLRGLRCVSIMSVSVLETLLTFLMTSAGCGTRWRMVSRLMGPARRNAAGDESGNELSDADAALNRVLCSGKIGLDGYRVVKTRIERLESGLGEIENGLNGLFRQLIKTRVSLLNLLSS